MSEPEEFERVNGDLRRLALADQVDAAQQALDEARKGLEAAQVAMDKARADYKAAWRSDGVRGGVPPVVLFALRNRQRELLTAKGRVALAQQRLQAAETALREAAR